MHTLPSFILLSGTVVITAGTGPLLEHCNHWQANCIQFV